MCFMSKTITEKYSKGLFIYYEVGGDGVIKRVIKIHIIGNCQKKLILNWIYF